MPWPSMPVRLKAHYRLRPPGLRLRQHPRRHASLSVPAEARHNAIGVQQLSSVLHPQVFPGTSTPPRQELVDLAKDHLQRHGLLGKNQDSAPPVGLHVPPLQGSTMDEHFDRLGRHAAEPYLSLATQFARAQMPPRPREWLRRSGWTKYTAGSEPEPVDAPDEQMLSFDVEVMWKHNNYAVMACAASPTAWYAWISPWLLGETDDEKQLVPLGDPTKARLVVGHNIGYDRARVREEYSLQQSASFFMDTMSLHVAVNGMCSQQRPTWLKHQKNRDLRAKIAALDDTSPQLQTMLESKILTDDEEELWVGRSSINSLRDVAKFHCGVTIDKAQRDYFSELDRRTLLPRLDELLDYCAADVAITHRVFAKVLPNFLQVCPHPVSFAALRHLSSVILPVDQSWQRYLQQADATYHQRLDQVQQRLLELADQALEAKTQPEVYTTDPWLAQLDWTGQEIRYKKQKKPTDPLVPVARQKKPGAPNWYRDLFPSSTAPISLTVRSRIAPLLLKLSWDGYPLVWSDLHGWTFCVPIDQAAKYTSSNATQADMTEETNLQLRSDYRHIYFKLPHKDGPTARCVSPLAKGYLRYFEAGTLSSQFALAKEALEMNASCSYWISARDRIVSQMVVGSIDSSNKNNNNNQSFILPQIIPMGTITRRAVENTWLTASNAKANRVGSELKAMVKAPPGYCFVGADVDSQELWIASLVGDAQFQLHGGNAIGFMTLEGTKAQGTDLHSKTAKILGISRNDAKVFNYGRIYGAGLKFAATLLRQFNPGLSEAQTAEIAANLYRETKGMRTSRKAIAPDGSSPFWRGGTESFVFNQLEQFANQQDRPRTPVLGAGITEALMRRFISNKASFMTSRINWAIQSSGVDYLHLLIVSMDYLIRRFGLNARLAITVHDEIRYLVKSEDRYRAAMALQVANLWTRAMFSHQMGINDLPQSCAFFSAVDIDHVLRKEVDMDCVTPSHPDPIPPGESIDIQQLLDKGEDQAALLDLKSPTAQADIDNELCKYTYVPRQPVLQSQYSSTEPNIPYLRAQITADDDELKAIIREVESGSTPSKSSSSSSGSKSGKGSKSSKSKSSTKTTRRKQPPTQPAPIPPHALPQQPVLMEVSDRWTHAYTHATTNNKPKPWLMDKKSSGTSTSSSLLVPSISWANDGWEV